MTLNNCVNDGEMCSASSAPPLFQYALPHYLPDDMNASAPVLEFPVPRPTFVPANTEE